MTSIEQRARTYATGSPYSADTWRRALIITEPAPFDLDRVLVGYVVQTWVAPDVAATHLMAALEEPARTELAQATLGYRRTLQGQGAELRAALADLWAILTEAAGLDRLVAKLAKALDRPRK